MSTTQNGEGVTGMRYASITDRLSSLGGDKWAVHNAARELVDKGEEIIELTIGEPDIPTDPDLVEECVKSLRAGRTRYSNGQGEPNLIDALVETYKSRMPEVAPENILCFPGTQTALFAIMQALTEAGDGVLIGDPYYATYEGVVQATGAHVEPVPLKIENGFVLQPEDLAAAVTPASRVLLLNTPHNPTGAVLDGKTIDAIGEVCIEHDLWIVSDEVYEELTFGAEFASPLQSPVLRERTIVTSSISKTFAATGFRSGWSVGPAELSRRLLPISETMLFGNQPFIADMTEAALRGQFDTASQLRTAFGRRARLVHEALDGAPGLVSVRPEGGMFIMIDVGGTGLSGEDFAWGLLKDKGVAVMPGSSFGATAESLIRLALTVPDDVLIEAVNRVVAFAGPLAEFGSAP